MAAAVKDVPTKASEIDLSGLSSTELYELYNKANNLRYERQNEEQNKKIEELLGDDVVATFKKKVKELNKEFKALPRKMSVTLQVPVRLDMDLSDTYENLTECLVQLSQYHGEFGVEDLIQGYDFTGKMLDKDNKLDKVQKRYFKEAVENMTEDACEESLNLFPDDRKKLRDFAKKVEAALKPLRETARTKGVTLYLANVLKEEE